MGSIAKSDRDSDVSKIAAIRELWIAAIKADDINGLVALASDDIVVVIGNGKCLCGKDELRKNLARDLALFDFEPRDTSDEIIVHDKWALLFGEVDTALTSVREGMEVQAHSRIIVVLARQLDGSWKVTRALGLSG